MLSNVLAEAMRIALERLTGAYEVKVKGHQH